MMETISMQFNRNLPRMAIVTREKLNGLGIHAGVLQPDGRVFHSTQEQGPHLVSFAAFAANRNVRVAHVIPYSEHHQVMIRICAELRKNVPYHLIENNCETIANRVAGRPESSSQVALVLILGLVGGLAFAARP